VTTVQNIPVRKHANNEGRGKTIKQLGVLREQNTIVINGDCKALDGDKSRCLAHERWGRRSGDVVAYILRQKYIKARRRDRSNTYTDLT